MNVSEIARRWLDERTSLSDEDTRRLLAVVIDIVKTERSEHERSCESDKLDDEEIAWHIMCALEIPDGDRTPDDADYICVGHRDAHDLMKVALDNVA